MITNYNSIVCRLYQMFSMNTSTMEKNTFSSMATTGTGTYVY